MYTPSHKAYTLSQSIYTPYYSVYSLSQSIPPSVPPITVCIPFHKAYSLDLLQNVYPITKYTYYKVYLPVQRILPITKYIPYYKV